MVHNLHQDWTIEICRTLNRGLLPPDYLAMTDQRVDGTEPDMITVRAGVPAAPGGLAVADAPPRARQIARVESDAAVYARRANRIVYDGGNGLTAYVDPVAVGDPLPDVPVFLAPGWYVNLPLEQTYLASWEVTPKPIRDLLAPR